MTPPAGPPDDATPDDSSFAALESTFRLVRRAQTGDQGALDQLFDRHLKPLERWARGRLPQWARDLADTDDVIQDTLLQTFKRIDDFEHRGVGALQAYLRQAVLNRIRDELRRKGRQPPMSALNEEDAAAIQSPLELAIGREGLEAYERALEQLRPEEREAIIARIEMGLSHAEVAEALGKPTVAAAHMAVSRALVHLAEEMAHDRKPKR